MIDMEQEIEIKWDYKHWRWYVDKGYTFTNWGDILKVKAKDLYPHSGIRIEYTCDICGAKQMTPLYAYEKINRELYGDTCKQCSTKKTILILKEKRQKDMYDKICNIANLKGYKLLFNIEDYENQRTKINYICSKHGEQKTSAAHFVRGECCKLCGQEKNADCNRLSIKEVIKRIEDEGCKLLNPEDYVSIGKRNLKIQCACGEIFYGCVNEIHKRYRCKKCAKSESVGENKIKHFLEENNIPYIPQYKYENCKDKRPLPFDFKLVNQEICIEFDGLHHYKPIRGEERLKYVQSHDDIKTNYCINNDIKLIRIKYDQWKNIDEILTKELLTT